MSEKRKILQEKATEAVQKGGLNNLSFRNLADEVGIKSSSVHYYFPEKADLACALIKGYTDTFKDFLETIDKSHKTLKAKIGAFVQIFVDVVKSEKFCLCGMLAAEIATLSDENKQLLADYFHSMEQWLIQKFEENTACLTVDIAPQQLAKLITSGLEGAMLLDRVDATTNRIDAQKKWIDSLIK